MNLFMTLHRIDKAPKISFVPNLILSFILNSATMKFSIPWYYINLTLASNLNNFWNCWCILDYFVPSVRLIVAVTVTTPGLESNGNWVQSLCHWFYTLDLKRLNRLSLSWLWGRMAKAIMQRFWQPDKNRQDYSLRRWSELNNYSWMENTESARNAKL